MGYYTSYILSIIEGDENLIEEFRKESEGSNYAIDKYGDTNESCKWYDSTKDIIEFSLKHPKTLFLLEGAGEDTGDEWKLYVQEGPTQQCRGKMVFPEFDKAKLLSNIRESKINK